MLPPAAKTSSSFAHSRSPLSLSLSLPHSHIVLAALSMFHLLANFMPVFSNDFDQSKTGQHMCTQICVHVCVCEQICKGVRAYIACIYACVNDLYVDVDVVEQLLAAQQQQSSVSFRRIFALYFRLTLPGNKPNLCCLNCALPFTLQLVVVTLSCCCCCCCCVSM